jgi:hypothetical protein
VVVHAAVRRLKGQHNTSGPANPSPARDPTLTPARALSPSAGDALSPECSALSRYSLGGGPSTPDIARESFTENKETGWLQVNPSAMLQEHAAGSGARIAQSLEVEALDRVYNALGERYAEARAEVEMLQRQVSNTLHPGIQRHC